MVKSLNEDMTTDITTGCPFLFLFPHPFPTWIFSPSTTRHPTISILERFGLTFTSDDDTDGLFSTYGNLGDYALDERTLDNIITRMMEAGEYVLISPPPPTADTPSWPCGCLSVLTLFVCQRVSTLLCGSWKKRLTPRALFFYKIVGRVDPSQRRMR